MADEKDIRELNDRILNLELKVERLKDKQQMRRIKYRLFWIRIFIGFLVVVTTIYLISLYGMNMSFD